MAALKPGDRVVHRERGSGRLLNLKLGQRARVRLDSAPGLPRTFPLSELALEEAEECDHAGDTCALGLRDEPVAAAEDSGYKNEEFSNPDRNVAKKLKVPIYLGTPSYTQLKYTPTTNKTTMFHAFPLGYSIHYSR